ncbi:MAG: hypothetical protein ACP5GS_07060 [Nitrososphaeria archaeon]
MKGYLLIKSKSKEEASCLSRFVKEKSNILDNYLMIAPDELDSIEEYRNLCGVKKLYFAFRFGSTTDLALYIEKNRKGKIINFVFEDGSQKDLYQLIDDFLHVSKNGRISEIEPEEVYKIIKIGEFYYLIQYESEGPGGICINDGQATVFVDGSYESYVLAYKFLCYGKNVAIIIPYKKDKNALKIVVTSLYKILKSCKNRVVNLYVLDLNNEPDNSSKVSFSLPIFLPKGNVYSDKVVSVPAELLSDFKIPVAVKEINTGINYNKFLNFNFSESTQITDFQNKPYHEALDAVLRNI